MEEMDFHLEKSKIVVTGGTGRFGRELKKMTFIIIYFLKKNRYS